MTEPQEAMQAEQDEEMKEAMGQPDDQGESQPMSPAEGAPPAGQNRAEDIANNMEPPD